MTPNKPDFKWVVRGITLFVFVMVVFIAYGSQQEKVKRLDKQVKELKTELNALKPANGEQKSAPPNVGGVPIFSDIQIKARDSKRIADTASLQTQMEAFYTQYGYYPSRTDMNNPAWLASNMKSLDKTSLTDPLNSTSSMTLVAKPTANFYSYDVTDTNGGSCEADHTKCAKYTITANLEGEVNGKKEYVRKNLD